jgi:hypothetical protein
MTGTRRGSQISIVLVALVVDVFLAAACNSDRYQLSQDKDGRTVRLDKRTGKIAVVVGDRLVSLKTAEQQESQDQQRRALDQVLAQPKPWRSQPFQVIGVREATLVTAWRDGTIYYQLDLQPIPKGYLETVSPTLFLLLQDGSGFEVVKVALGRNDLSNIVDDEGKSIKLSANSSVACSKDTYESLSSWTLHWTF